MNVFFIRHGESMGNRQGKIQGWMDFELSELGIKQAQLLAAYSENLALDYLYSSDLTRAYDTAKAIAARNHLDVRKWTKVREVHLGPLQGLSRPDIYERFPETKERSILTSGLEGTESVEQLTKRCRFVVEQLLLAHQNDNIAIVSHGGFISILLTYLLAGEQWPSLHRAFQIGNTSITHVEWTKEQKPVIHYTNQTIHLSSLLEPSNKIGLL
ncbi:histidine phosphatase family protein [Halalkalibacter oceani]|uniref:histidine phosphatase family protein n=1 Tax=Halalkalibacter oceani TaxID=1653776 RepID=UPI003391E1AF